jgi:hypothetical protein
MANTLLDRYGGEGSRFLIAFERPRNNDDGGQQGAHGFLLHRCNQEPEKPGQASGYLVGMVTRLLCLQVKA